MLIEVFGTGCAKCKQLEQHAHQAIERSGGNHQVVKVSDYAAMTVRGVLSTPALAVDGQIKIQGRVASPEDILALLQA
jgi:small redox-active disulfide protein 2